MKLPINTYLQNEKYRIEKVLGQGGFGITYLAWHEMLECKVAIKEFFFKEYCNRNETTNQVNIPTVANTATVERFQQKFIKEAKTIFKLKHPNIIQIYDIFTENGTAYYVMEHIEGPSLNQIVNQHGALAEGIAIKYIKKVGNALTYIHEKNINHLDIKPSNIMIRESDNEPILIDFGVAKQYDSETLEGTTTTPVGISHGYSPLEQYRSNGVQEFSPQSDVYALAATLFKLLTGNTPPEAIEVQEEGIDLDELNAKSVSKQTIDAIVAAMKSRKKRPQSVMEFMDALPDIGAEDVVVAIKHTSSTLTSSLTEKKSVEPIKEEFIESTKEEKSIEKIENSCEETVILPNDEFNILISSGNKVLDNHDVKDMEAMLTQKEKEFCQKHGLSLDTGTPVDLGLGVKWCNSNLQGSSPVSEGQYFPKLNSVINKGSSFNWRMPTIEELAELKNKCNWKWIAEEGILGYLITSKTTGNSIFFRCAGKKENSNVTETHMGFYWSSSNSILPNNAYYMVIMQESVLPYLQTSNKIGCSIRLVCE